MYFVTIMQCSINKYAVYLHFLVYALELIVTFCLQGI